MAGFDQSQRVIKAHVLGARDDAAGALSSNWTIWSTGVTPGDIAVILSTVNVFDQPTTAATSPAAYRNDKALTNPGYWRATAVCKADTNKAGRILFGIRLGTANSSTALATWDICAEFNQNNNTIRINKGNAVQTSFPFTITVDVWYRIGIEVVNDRVRLFFNTSSGADPTLAPGPETMTQVGEITLTPGAGPAYPCMVFGGAGGSFSGLGDFSFDELDPPNPSSGGGGQSMNLSSPYTRYKSVRAARFMLNNIQLGP